jgi:hypothetical protein
MGVSRSRTFEFSLDKLCLLMSAVRDLTVGYRVIQTIGVDLADVDFHRGWCIEFAASMTGTGSYVLRQI